MCAKCHGEVGEGSDRGPDLTDDQWQHGDGSVEAITEVLKHGVSKEELADPSRPFGMNPATKLVDDPAELDALAAYVWSLSRG
jgi:mono/diheme cytochrome c family protein